MDIALFVQVLSNLLPSEDLMKKNGFSEMPDSIKKIFILPKRQLTSDIYDEAGLISELFKTFEVKYLSFGDFSFNDKLYKKEGFFVFAESSYSELTFVNTQSEIIEFDNEENSLLNYCASNSSNFLLALLIILELFSLRYQGIVETHDNKVNEDYLHRCTIAAGGGKYSRFYKGVIGV